MSDYSLQLVPRVLGDKVTKESSRKVHSHLSLVSIIVYEGGSVMQQARSLWRLELARIKWAGGYINWYHPMRIRHITTGLYLGVREESMDLCLMPKSVDLFHQKC